MLEVTDNIGNNITVIFKEKIEDIKETIKERNEFPILPYNRSNLLKNEVDNLLEVYNRIENSPSYIPILLDNLCEKHMSNEYYYTGQTIPLAYVSNIYDKKSYGYGEGFANIPIILRLDITDKNEVTISLGNFGLGDCKYYSLYNKTTTVNKVLKYGLDKTVNIENGKLDILSYRYLFKNDIGEEPKELSYKAKKSNYSLQRKKSLNKIIPEYKEERKLGIKNRIFYKKDKKLLKEGFVKVVSYRGSNDDIMLMEKYNILYKGIKEHLYYKKELGKISRIIYYKEEYILNSKDNSLIKLC